MKNEKTVGALAAELLAKPLEVTHPIDQMRANLEEYENNMVECYNDAKKKYNSDFYIVVLFRKEKLMINASRNVFFHRMSCPTPNYEQSVYRYDKKDDAMKLLWTIPDIASCRYLKINALSLDGDDRALLRYVVDHSDGSLLNYAKRLNGEKSDSSFLEK